MSFLEILMIAIALGIDAFSVSICKGLTLKNFQWKHAIRIACYFGAFQGIMPLLGFLLGKSFETIIVQIDHWIAFVLLTGIGFPLLKDGFSSGKEQADDRMDWKALTTLAIATSIDALAVGITLSFLNVDLHLAVGTIGVVAFLMSVIGVKIGERVGKSFQQKAKIYGGVILIGIGLKILLEHLFQ